ncbi:MAG: ribosome small subunit-dependent GTPase A [Firmicutes bacterium]|jgi:ribosome biogenesis GTPase|nr:ribosome small subunit-dependent GTPase A [Bacillota bacterium]MDH7495486.1 ribosome small subunit-dependent GTPase A [Bacillota bacterium]
MGERVPEDNLRRGLVLQIGNDVYHVLVDGRAVLCTIRRRLVRETGSATNPVAPGDLVRLALLEHDKGVIEEIEKRRNSFGRRAAGDRPGEQVIAANVDRIVIVFAAAEPAFRARALDRYLAVAEHSGIPCIVCLNKIDLVSPEDVQGMAAPYEEIGYRVLRTCVRTGQGVDELNAVLSGRISVVVGPSGVGKSSLLNAVEPGIKLATGEVGKTTHRGRHTTTASRLIPLTAGGFVADTAGMREFGLWEIPARDLAPCFREMRPYIGRCRFSDCVHVSEPECAVRDAVESGFIRRSRYEHYVKLVRGGPC